MGGGFQSEDVESSLGSAHNSNNGPTLGDTTQGMMDVDHVTRDSTSTHCEPTTSASSGCGRGRAAILPAWMTMDGRLQHNNNWFTDNQHQSTSSSSSTARQEQESMDARLGHTRTSGASASVSARRDAITLANIRYHSTSSSSSSARHVQASNEVRMGYTRSSEVTNSGMGRGRGAVLPAWMTTDDESLRFRSVHTSTSSAVDNAESDGSPPTKVTRLPSAPSGSAAFTASRTEGESSRHTSRFAYSTSPIELPKPGSNSSNAARRRMFASRKQGDHTIMSVDVRNNQSRQRTAYRHQEHHGAKLLSVEETPLAPLPPTRTIEVENVYFDKVSALTSRVGSAVKIIAHLHVPYDGHSARGLGRLVMTLNRKPTTEQETILTKLGVEWSMCNSLPVKLRSSLAPTMVLGASCGGFLDNNIRDKMVLELASTRMEYMEGGSDDEDSDHEGMVVGEQTFHLAPKLREMANNAKIRQHSISCENPFLTSLGQAQWTGDDMSTYSPSLFRVASINAVGAQLSEDTSAGKMFNNIFQYTTAMRVSLGACDMVYPYPSP